ncbi:MAG: hypothetical protein RLN62_00340 [Rickettsiales bacterium]
MKKRLSSLPSNVVSISFIWSFMFYLLNMNNLFNDHDVFWHIEAGHRIVQEKSTILNNGWSFTSPNHTWYNISWLWDLCLYFSEVLFSIKFIYFITAFIYALIISLLAHYLLLFKSFKAFNIIFTIFMTTLVLWDFTSPRPYTLTILFSLMYLILLKKYSTNKKTKSLYLLPPIMLIWSNTHGGFIVGCYLLIVYFLCNFKTINRRFFLVSIVTMLCVFINPYFHKILNAVLSTTNSDFTKSIDEWQPLSFGKHQFVFCLYLLFFIGSLNIKNINLTFFDKLNSIVWLLMSLMYIRNIPIFLIMSSAFFTSNVQSLNVLRALNIEIKNNDKSGFFLSLVSLLMLSIAFFTGCWRDVITPYNNPIPAIKFIMHKYPQKKFFNDYGLGGAIIYFSKGNQKVFVDGRAGTAYPESVLQEYKNSKFNTSSLISIFKKHKIDGVISDKNSSISKSLFGRKNWSLVFNNNDYLIYVKQ